MDGTGIPVVKKETVGRQGKTEGEPSHTREVNPLSANRCSISTILESPALQPLQLGSKNPEKRL
jgi:hypothetical protein